MSMASEHSAGAVVYLREQGKPEYLLLHYGAGHWDLPKGKVEKGESIEETAKREIREETGIKAVEFTPGFKEEIKYVFTREGEKVFKTVDFLLAETSETKVALSFEHIGYEWLPFDEAVERLTYKNAKGLLAKADAFLASRE